MSNGLPSESGDAYMLKDFAEQFVEWTQHIEVIQFIDFEAS